MMRNSLNVLILSKYFPPVIDGVGDHTKNLIHGLKKLKPKLRLFLATGEAGAPHRHLYKTFFFNRWDGDEFAQLMGFISENKIDTLVVQYVPYSFNRYGVPLRFLSRLWRLASAVRLIFVVHEARIRIIPWQKHVLIGIGQAISLKLIYHIAEKVITSNALYSSLLSKQDPLQKISIIPIGSNLERPARALPPEPSTNSFTIATFGQNFQASNIILNALKLLTKDLPGVQIIFIGSISQIGRQDIETKVAELGMHANVVITGPITSAQIATLLQSSDLFIMKEGPMVNQWPGTSLRNGTFAAALQAGLPVIGYKGPITDIALTNQPFLFLLEKYEEASLAANIKGYYNLAEEVKVNLREQALRFYRENLSWTKISSQFLDVINDSGLN